MRSFNKHTKTKDLVNLSVRSFRPILRAVLLTMIVSSLFSCEKIREKQSDIKFGEVLEYYPAFGKNYKDQILTVKLNLDFNKYAVQENAFVDLEFVDKDGRAVPGIKYFINGAPFKSGTYQRLRAKEYDGQNIEVGLQFQEGIEEKNHKGYLRVRKSDLDRIDDTDLGNAQNPTLYRWTARYRLRMHPILVGTLIALASILTGLLLWFILLKPIFYPRFKGGEFEFLQPDLGSVRIKGYRQFVIGGKNKVKQSFLSKLFTGKIGQGLKSENIEIVLNPQRKRGTIWTRYKADSALDMSSGNRGTFYNFEEYDFKDNESKNKYKFVYKNRKHKRRY